MPHLLDIAIKRLVHGLPPPSVGKSVDEPSWGSVGAEGELLQGAELTADLDEGSDRLVEVMTLVSGGELDTDASLTLGDDGVVEARDVDPFIQQASGVLLRELRIVEHHGTDG